MKRSMPILLPLSFFILLAGCREVTRAPQPIVDRPPRPEVTIADPEPYVRVIDEAKVETEAQPALKTNPLDTIRLETVHFSDVPLNQAALMLTKMIGQNIVVSSEAGAKKIDVYLKNVTARAAIEGICRLNGLWYREDPEMLRLLTKDEYGKELIIKRDEQTRLYYLKNASAPAVADMIATLMGDQVEYLRPEEEASFGHVGTDGDDPLSNTSATGSGTNGNNRYSNSYPNAEYDTRGGGGTSSRTNSRSVSRSSYNYSLSDVTNGYQKALTNARIEQLAKTALDRQKGEVNAQTVAEKTGEKPPVSISVFLRNNCIGVRTIQESTHREIAKLIESLDTPTRQVLLECKVLKVELGNGFESFFNLAYSNGTAPKVTAKWLDTAELSGHTVSFAYLDHHITATIQALQTDSRLHLVATPMLLCANNAPADFFSGVTRMIVTNYDYETRYAENNQAVDVARPVVEEREIGTTVRIKPSINTDGTLTLRFFLELASVNDGAGSIYQVKSNGDLVKLPTDTVNNERVESIVSVKHGQAVVMGGLINDSVVKAADRVPILGNLPGAGILFRKQKDKVSRSETVIIIIPHIISPAEQGEAASNNVLKENVLHPYVTRGANQMTEWDGQKRRIDETERSKGTK